MQVLVSHLTRMQRGYFCAAGLDISTGKHVRPALGQRLWADLLRHNGGPFALAAVVDLGPVTYGGAAPEIEDYLFKVANLKFCYFVDESGFIAALNSAVSPSLRSIFGHSLAVDGGGLALPQGLGKASLGCVKSDTLSLSIDSYNKVKLSFTDPEFYPTITVTDIRLYEADQETPNYGAFHRLKKKLNSSSSLINVGLSRAFVKRGDDEAKHWLQVNNIHLEKDPLGQWAIE